MVYNPLSVGQSVCRESAVERILQSPLGHLRPQIGPLIAQISPLKLKMSPSGLHEALSVLDLALSASQPDLSDLISRTLLKLKLALVTISQHSQA